MKRNEILDLVKSCKAFKAGKTTIPFAGRIFDGEELVTLVSSSLNLKQI